LGNPVNRSDRSGLWTTCIGWFSDVESGATWCNLTLELDSVYYIQLVLDPRTGNWIVPPLEAFVPAWTVPIQLWRVGDSIYWEEGFKLRTEEGWIVLLDKDRNGRAEAGLFCNFVFGCDFKLLSGGSIGPVEACVISVAIGIGLTVISEGAFGPASMAGVRNACAGGIIGWGLSQLD
jgi:hypothetical protein